MPGRPLGTPIARFKLFRRAGRDNVAIAWDAKTGRNLKTFRGAGGQIWSVAFSKDCKQVAHRFFGCA